jgi:hypothetical protein
MRRLVLVVGLLVGAVCQAADPAPRYGVDSDLKSYPQARPEETLASVLKAIEAKRFDYLAAQLADPDFIDERVKRLYDGRFKEQVADTQARMDVLTVKLLMRFAKDGKWKTEEGKAWATLEDAPDRVVRMRQLAGRWYLEHSATP